MGIMRSCSRVRDSAGQEWFTIAEAAREVDRSRRTLERWVATGLPIQRVRNVRYVSADDLFARLRLILLTEPESKTRREG